jgi:hypothetical protein
MANITKDGLSACLDFGMASLAVANVAELVGDQLPDGEARELLGELEAAHRRLCDLFDDGQIEPVHTLALSILLLADLTTDAVREGRDRPGE